ncbi:MAG: phBC6A51 family helix-turn-helix protein [Thermodesulfobacteriota bacterium]
MNLRKKASELLTPKQKQAISELTRQDNNSFKEVAKKVGISIATLYRWRKKPEFSSALEDSFRELKEKIESKVVNSTSILSLVDIVKYYTTAHETLHIDSSVLLLIIDTVPQLIESQNKFVLNYSELNTKLNNLKKNLIEINRDNKKMRKEIMTLASLLK